MRLNSPLIASVNRCRCSAVTAGNGRGCNDPSLPSLPRVGQLIGAEIPGIGTQDRGGRVTRPEESRRIGEIMQ